MINDCSLASSYYANMPRRIRPDWYLAEWMAQTGVKAADIVRATDWPKSKVSELVNGKQPYKREIVNDLARVFHIRAYELLMHPDDAYAIRRWRDASIALAAESGPDSGDDQPDLDIPKRQKA